MLERPLIEFIQAQMLPWRRIGPGLARPDAEYKYLSRDAATGACSLLIRYPPGWRREGPEYLDAAEEFYVLDGVLEIDGTRLGHDSYGRIPARANRLSLGAPRGAVVLTFFDREPVHHGQPGEPFAFAGADVLHAPWDMSLNDPKLAHLGISRKDLHQDPLTGERTFLSMVLPHSEPPGLKGPQERHPIVEECYVIAGSLVGPHGEMHAGAYFWRPAGIAHGPFGTRWGCVMLIRFVGGRHVNLWTAEDAPFDFDAPYRPALPEALKPFAEVAWTPAPRY